MEFPHGHHHHHHDGPFHRREEEEERHPPPPPPAYGEDEGPYGGPQHGEVEGRYGRPHYGEEEGRYGRQVQHVSHVSHHVEHERNDSLATLMKQPTVRIYCKGNEGVSLTIRDGVVLLATTNENDERQHWIKDLKYSTRVKDEEGYPAFSLVNKATGQALKHSLGESHPVELVKYNPDLLEESVLWTESRDVGSGYRCIRMVNNIYLNFDGFHGDKDHGGVHDGTTLVLWKWTEGDNQRWKIVPW